MVYTRDWRYFPVLYSRSSLFVHSKCNTLHLLISNSQGNPPSPPRPPPQVYSLCLWDRFCFVDRFILAMFYFILLFYYFISFLFLFLFFGGPWHMEFQGQGPDLRYSCSLSSSCAKARSLTLCARLGIKPATQCSLDADDPVVPR